MAALRLGDPAPEFSLPGTDGGTYSLSDYLGQPLAVVFLVSATARTSWPGEDRLNDVRARLRRTRGARRGEPERGLSRRRAGRHAATGREKGFVFPFLYDETLGSPATTYGAARTPEVFVFDADHRLVYHGAPDSDRPRRPDDDPYLRPALDAALAGSTPAVQETPPVGCTVSGASPSSNTVLLRRPRVDRPLARCPPGVRRRRPGGRTRKATSRSTSAVDGSGTLSGLMDLAAHSLVARPRQPVRASP